MLNFKNRKYGILPRIENSCLSADQPVTAQRIRLWVKARVHIKGSEDYVFIKLHTHGCAEDNLKYLLNGGLDNLSSIFLGHYNDGINYATHFVTARETANIIKAIEDGVDSGVKTMRDYRYEKINTLFSIRDTKYEALKAV